MFDEKLNPDTDLNIYFDVDKYNLINIGDVVLDTGEIVVCDPLCCLGMGYNKIPPLVQRVLIGKYPVTISVFDSKEYGIRYMASKLSFSNKMPVRFQLATKKGDNLVDLKEDEIFGFPVDAGLACFCDRHTEILYEEFYTDWHNKNPNKNHYDDYFSEIFEKSYREKPQYQRSGGDWINWYVPNTENNITMFNTGFGDGFYPCYWGYDEQSKICCLIIQFINPSTFDEGEE